MRHRSPEDILFNYSINDKIVVFFNLLILSAKNNTHTHTSYAFIINTKEQNLLYVKVVRRFSNTSYVII